MFGPSPLEKRPMRAAPHVCFLKNIVKSPNIIAGDYTAVHLVDENDDFEKNVLYHYDFIGDKLIFGKFCGIARKAKFIMNGSHHILDGISTYPFQVFGNGWEKVMPPLSGLAVKGDTIVANDVWICYDSLIMPGIHIGNGAVVGARSVVTRDVPAYSIVAGNPARVVRMRYSKEEIALIESIAWWDWPPEKITKHLDVIVKRNLRALQCAAEE